MSNKLFDPISDLEQIQDDMQGVRSRNLKLLARTYKRARDLAQDPAAAQRLRKHDFFTGIEFPRDLLMATLRFAYKARETNTNDYKTAAFAHSAFKQYFHHAVAAEALLVAMKKVGGIEPLKVEQPWPPETPQPKTWKSRSATQVGGDRAKRKPSKCAILVWRSWRLKLHFDQDLLKQLKHLPSGEAASFTVQNLTKDGDNTTSLQVYDIITG